MSATPHSERVPTAAAGSPKFSFGTPTATESADRSAVPPIAPAAGVEDQATKATKTPSTPPIATSATPDATPQATRAKPEPYDYKPLSGGTRRIKDPGGMISEDLARQLPLALSHWTAENWSDLAAQGKSAPTIYAFREALLRVGLKHITDPELMDLLPMDGRRRRNG